MKFLTGIALALEALSLVGCAAAEPEIVVDRLVSRRNPPLSQLEKRGKGFGNGGNQGNTGKWSNGKLKNRKNYEISFYHINDVHACVYSYCSPIAMGRSIMELIHLQTSR
jgi:5'-nucleotidase